MKYNILFLGEFSPLSLVNRYPKFGLDRYKDSVFLLKGMRNDPEVNVDVITSPDIPSWPHFPKLFVGSISDIDEKIKSLSVFNLPVIKHVWIVLSLFFEGARYIQRHRHQTTTIIVPYIYYNHTAPARMLKVLYGKKIRVVTVVPDIFFPKGFFKLLNKRAERHTKKSDAFVLYTDAMADYLQIASKPHITMESLIDVDDYSWSEIKGKNDKTVILYTGALHRYHGVQKLLEMMKRIQRDDIELWITGVGELYDELLKWPSYDARIKFLGTVEKSHVFELQKQADILINPRSDMDSPTVTQYMFPSKLMEYMLSGNPVVACPMSGIPEEYKQYLYYAKDGSLESLVGIMQQVLDTPEEERILRGERARGFILNNKSITVQGLRVTSLIKQIQS